MTGPLQVPGHWNPECTEQTGMGSSKAHDSLLAIKLRYTFSRNGNPQAAFAALQKSGFKSARSINQFLAGSQP